MSLVKIIGCRVRSLCVRLFGVGIIISMRVVSMGISVSMDGCGMFLLN